MKKIIIIVSIIIVIIIAVLFMNKDEQEPILNEELDTSEDVDSDTGFGDIMENLEGIKISGEVQAAFYANRYSMKAVFNNLPNHPDDYFYEGWIIRKKPYDIINTGALNKEGGSYTNIFGSDFDLTDYNFYLLTVEPRDRDFKSSSPVLEIPIEIFKDKHAF